MKLFAIICAVLVALCWGLYGPAVANGRAPNREWGPFKPYVFIGLAYTVIAVFGSILMMKTVFTDNLNYTGEYWPAAKWGFLAGALGAVGALFLTFALTKAGGKPAYVMPIVFGGAVTVNAIYSYVTLHDGHAVNPLLWVGMAFVAIGICLTAYFAPHGGPPAAHPAPATEVAAVAETGP